AEEKPVAEVPPVEEEPEDEVIRAKAQRLSGPNVIGKIQLPVNEPKRNQPVASSSNTNGAADHKRKRKRKEGGGPQQGGGQGNQQQQNNGTPNHPNRQQGDFRNRNQQGGGN